MGNKKDTFSNYKKIDQIDEWYDQFEDSQPFDAFGNEENKSRIGDEIYAGVQQHISHSKQVYLYLRIAAAILLVIGGSIIAFIYSPRSSPNKSISAWTIISTGANENKRITLPDSSVIKLSPYSRIRFASSFNSRSDRSIYLEEGRAFFDVSKNQERPFMVYIKGFTIRVLGTSFTVSAYNNQQDLKVEVVSGKIKVEQDAAPGKGIMLAEEVSKGQSIMVNRTTSVFTIEQKFNTNQTANTSKRQLKELTLQQIGVELGNRFNLYVQLNNPENDTSLYVVDFNQPLYKILKSLSAQTGFTYNIVNNQHLIINPKTF